MSYSVTDGLVFTARYIVVQSAVFWSHVVCLWRWWIRTT